MDKIIGLDNSYHAQGVDRPEVPMNPVQRSAPFAL